MHIWVDADTCPHVIKDLLYRAANRLENSADAGGQSTPPHPHVAVYPHAPCPGRVRWGRSGHRPARPCGRPGRDRGRPAGRAGGGQRRPCAESPRLGLYPGEHSRTPDHAPRHGGAAPERRADGWAIPLQPAGPASVWESLGPVLDTRGSDRIGRHRVSIEHARHQCGRPTCSGGGALHPHQRRLAVGAKRPTVLQNTRRRRRGSGCGCRTGVSPPRRGNASKRPRSSKNISGHGSGGGALR